MCLFYLAIAQMQHALSHKGATGVVKERMDIMSEIAKHTKTLQAMLSGAKNYDAAKVKTAAQAIGNHAKNSPPLYPKGSLQHPTEVRENIWTDWEEFQKQFKYLQIYASALAISADNSSNPRYRPGNISAADKFSDGWPQPAFLQTLPPQAAFLYISETCRTCHKMFRRDK
ncbi:MAG: cytochrome c [Pseudomonadota bacterium]